MHDQFKVGSIAALHRYPVKSMMGEEINASWIGAKGILGDRAFALADPETGKIASAKNPSKWPNLFEFRAAFTGTPSVSAMLPPVQITFPDGSAVTTDSESVESLLAASLSKPVRFLKTPEGSGTLEEYWPDIEGLARRDEVTDEAMPSETFFDVGIIHILTTGTLTSLREAYPAGQFETRRFRPNLVIKTGPDAGEYPEQQWDGKILAIGPNVKLKITGACFRCVMTTLEQGDLPRDNGILRAAAKNNEARVGAYASVIHGGMIKRGDAVVISPG